MHRASLSAWDSRCSLWLLGLVFIFSCIGWVMHTALRFVYLEVLDGLPIAYLQVFVCWAARYGLYSYYCGTRSIWSSISPLLFIHCVHTWLFLTLFLGRAISEYVLTLLSVSSKLHVGPNLLALRESSFVSRRPVCLPESLLGVSMDADSLHEGHQQLSRQQSCAGVRMCLIMTAGGAAETACQALGEKDANR